MAAHVYPGKLIGAHASIHRNLPTALFVEALVYSLHAESNLYTHQRPTLAREIVASAGDFALRDLHSFLVMEVFCRDGHNLLP